MFTSTLPTKTLPAMRANSSFPLDDDLVDRVMCFLPDFDSLRALALSCKSVYAVWKGHPRSIAVAIAENVVGPTWPYALRTARLMLLSDEEKGWVGPTPIVPVNLHRPRKRTSQRSSDDEGHDDDEDGDDDDNDDNDDEGTDYNTDDDTDDDNSDDDASQASFRAELKSAALAAVLHLPDEREDSSVQITFCEGKHLETMGGVARTLEYEFAQRWKDSSLGPACLTEEEKFRFHRAVHRLWAFQTAFGSAGLSDRNFASALPHSWLKPAQATFLDVLGNEELFEIKDILLFYTAYAQWVGSARNIGSSHSWLFSEVMTTGPALLPQVASGANWYPSYNYSTSNAAQRTLDVLAKARGINDDRWGSEAGVGAIVRSTSGRAFQCERCNVSSRQVYGVANWHLLRGDVTFGIGLIISLLPGHLRLNDEIKDRFNNFVGHSSWSPGETMSEMFDQEEANDSGAGWLRTQRMCLTCVQQFLREHLVGWWKSRPEAGNIPQDNCWYGWSCRTQTHKTAHAQKLNHLCVPTKGNGA